MIHCLVYLCSDGPKQERQKPAQAIAVAEQVLTSTRWFSMKFVFLLCLLFFSPLTLRHHTWAPVVLGDQESKVNIQSSGYFGKVPSLIWVCSLLHTLFLTQLESGRRRDQAPSWAFQAQMLKAQLLHKPCTAFSSFKLKSTGICTKKIILLCLALSLVSSSTLHLGSVTKCYSIFLWGDWGTTWLRILCEAMQKACAINCRMAAGVSSRVVLSLLLVLRCLSSWDPQCCYIPSLWGCMFKNVNMANLYSGRKKN